MTQATQLAKGIVEMHLAISEATQEKLLAYLALLQKWNKIYNLTAVRDPEEMVTLHLLDSLSVLPHTVGKRLLDVGSGAGLPGIILAIVQPELQVTTIDAVQKKAIFMRQVKGELALSNLQVVHARVEQYQTVEKFDMIISRAFSEIALFVNLTKHLLKENGRWLAMKGLTPSEEMATLTALESQIIPLQVAGLQAQRHLVIARNKILN